MFLMQGAKVTEHRNMMMPVLGLVPCAQGLAGAFAWGVGDPFGIICTGSDNGRSYAITT